MLTVNLFLVNGKVLGGRTYVPYVPDKSTSKAFPLLPICNDSLVISNSL